MRFEQILLLSMASIIFIFYLPTEASDTLTSIELQSPPTVKPNDPSKDLDNARTKKALAASRSSKSTTREILDILGCIAKQWSLNESQWSQCYEVFLTYWNSSGYLQDSEISESEKSKKKRWDTQTLMLGGVVKLLLFLPIFAILTGKAISLSLMSFLVTSLTFLYKSQSDSFFGRSDFNGSSWTN